jgi:nucleoside-diphosphate-sugar epimerase
LIFLTGGTGYLGRRVCEALRQHHHIQLLTRSARAVPEGVTAVVADLLDADAYRHALAMCDTVIHVAAATGRTAPREHNRVNAEGTGRLVAECHRAGVRRMLFTSTIAVTFPDTTAYDYAQSKIRAEAAVRASDLRFTIVRPTIILGRGSANLAAFDRLAGLPIIPVFGNGRSRVQPILGDDLAAFIAEIVERDRFDGETLEFGGPVVLTVEELLQAIRRARTGSSGRTFHLPLRLTLASLRAVRSLGLEALLPVSAGQLSVFRFDSTAQANTLYDSRRDTLAGLERMLS